MPLTHLALPSALADLKEFTLNKLANEGNEGLQALSL